MQKNIHGGFSASYPKFANEITQNVETALAFSAYNSRVHLGETVRFFCDLYPYNGVLQELANPCLFLRAAFLCLDLESRGLLFYLLIGR